MLQSLTNGGLPGCCSTACSHTSSSKPNRTKRVIFDLKVQEQHCMEKILSSFSVPGGNVGRVLFLVWSNSVPRPKGPHTVLRAVDEVFREHGNVDGVACKYDGTKKNATCIEAALRRGSHVNLYAMRPDLVQRMLDYAPRCTCTLPVTSASQLKRPGGSRASRGT